MLPVHTDKTKAFLQIILILMVVIDHWTREKFVQVEEDRSLQQDVEKKKSLSQITTYLLKKKKSKPQHIFKHLIGDFDQVPHLQKQ